MNILYVVDNYPPHIGGVETVFSKYAEHFSSIGFKVRVVTSNTGGITGVEYRNENLTIYRNECSFLFGHAILKFSDLSAHVKWANIVHTTLYASGFLSSLLSWFYNKSSILMVLEVLGNRWKMIESNKIYALFYRFVEWMVLNAPFSLYQSISRATMADMIAFGINSEKIRLAYLGVDPSVWNPSVQKVNLEQMFDLPREKRIFLYTGRPGKTKGLLFFLEALQIIDTGIPDDVIFLFVLSQTPAKSRCEIVDYARKFFPNKVFVRDSVSIDILPSVRISAYVNIVPSLTEGFGFTAAETAMLNTRMLCSNAGSIPEVVHGAVLLYDYTSLEDCANKMKEAFQGHFNCYDFVDLSWKPALQSVQNIYESIE